MNFYRSLEDCWEIVVSSMASEVERLQNELHFKQKRIEQLELQNEALKIKLEPAGLKHHSMPCAIAPLFDSSKDPFEDGGADE